MNTDNPNIYLLIIAGMLFSLFTGIAVILFYTRYHKRLSMEQEKIRDAKLQHQKELLYATIQSQEEERKRIGQDLHDDVGSLLAKVKMSINKVNEIYNNKEDAYNKQLIQLIEKSIENVRGISHRLTPASLEFFGFTDALEELCMVTEKSTGIVVDLKNTAELSLENFKYTTALHLFRVFEELITNTIKHAEARCITITLFKENSVLYCNYEDDGKGFDSGNGKSGIGLYNINSRLSIIGGSHTIHSALGKGIKVNITIPFESKLEN